MFILLEIYPLLDKIEMECNQFDFNGISDSRKVINISSFYCLATELMIILTNGRKKGGFNLICELVIGEKKTIIGKSSI